MLATRKIAEEVCSIKRQDRKYTIGMEYSGIDSSGKRLMGINYNALSNLCEVDNDFAWEIPNHWSLEDGATVPAVFATSYLALYIRGTSTITHNVLFILMIRLHLYLY